MIRPRKLTVRFSGCRSELIRHKGTIGSPRWSVPRADGGNALIRALEDRPMESPLLIIVTGLPAAGKTTLARELARLLRAPLIGKDMIKEPLLDVLGAGDGARSRQLSTASFAVQFAIA